MMNNIGRSAYTIHVTCERGECLASIPELCIAEKGATPQDALSAALRVEMKIRETIQDRGEELPPQGDLIVPFPRFTRWVGNHIVFFRQVVIGYVLVACITAALLIVFFPSARSLAEQNLKSKDFATDVRKALSLLGVAICLENR